MKRIDQYIDQLKKENGALSALENVITLKELFQYHNGNDNKDSEKNKTIRFALISQHMFYTCVKENNLLR